MKKIYVVQRSRYYIWNVEVEAEDKDEALLKAAELPLPPVYDSIGADIRINENVSPSAKLAEENKKLIEVCEASKEELTRYKKLVKQLEKNNKKLPESLIKNEKLSVSNPARSVPVRPGARTKKARNKN